MASPEGGDRLDTVRQSVVKSHTHQLPDGERSPLLLRWTTDVLAADRAGVYSVMAYMDDPYRQILATIVTGALGVADLPVMLDPIATSEPSATAAAAVGVLVGAGGTADAGPPLSEQLTPSMLLAVVRSRARRRPAPRSTTLWKPSRRRSCAASLPRAMRTSLRTSRLGTADRVGGVPRRPARHRVAPR
jgi:hypothetical protein